MIKIETITKRSSEDKIRLNKDILCTVAKGLSHYTTNKASVNMVLSSDNFSDYVKMDADRAIKLGQMLINKGVEALNSDIVYKNNLILMTELSEYIKDGIVNKVKLTYLSKDGTNNESKIFEVSICLNMDKVNKIPLYKMNVDSLENFKFSKQIPIDVTLDEFIKNMKKAFGVPVEISNPEKIYENKKYVLILEPNCVDVVRGKLADEDIYNTIKIAEGEKYYSSLNNILKTWHPVMDYNSKIQLDADVTKILLYSRRKLIDIYGKDYENILKSEIKDKASINIDDINGSLEEIILIKSVSLV